MAAVGERSATAAGWHLILGRDGTVLATTDDATTSWVGTRLEDCDAPEDLKEAGRRILAGSSHLGPATAERLSLRSLGQPVFLTIVDALPLRRTPTDLRTLLSSSLEVLQRQAKALDVALDLSVDRRVPAIVSLDGEKIAWATTVLVGNALRYVHHGSRVMPGGSIAVRVTYNSDGPEVTIEVQDDGPGIPADKLSALFNAGPDHARVGLGLLMVRDVVAAHGGHLEVHSDAEAFRRGATIRLTLPAL